MFISDFFTHNRQVLSEKVDNTVFILTANGRVQKSNDVSFRFRQDSNFWYITGCDEPDAIVVLDTENPSNTTLYIAEKDEHQKQWEGEYDLSELSKNSGIQNIRYTHRIQEDLRELRKNKRKFMSNASNVAKIEQLGMFSNPAKLHVHSLLSSLSIEYGDARKILAEIRMVKQPLEVAAITQAVHVTTECLSATKEKLLSYNSEQEIEREISAYFVKHADGHAYQPIIGSGKNAATIHYEKNSSTLLTDELVLLDVGALHGLYAADISRTWIYGTATKKQKDLHEMVVEWQKYVYSLLKPGVLLKDVQQKLEVRAKQDMKKYGVSMGKSYPHAISHHLGLDVHDPALYDIPLAKNMIITVEPGLYLPDKNIGIRIEDDVLITDTGIDVLSKGLSTSL